MNSLREASEIFSKCVLDYRKCFTLPNERRKHFRRAQIVYKSILDRNLLGKFCIGGHCKTVYIIEIRYNGSVWAATPKTFYSREEAETEIEMFRKKYSFIDKFRVVERKEREED